MKKGLPDDCCKQVKALAEMWGVDGHSHSYLTLSELQQSWDMLQNLKTPISGMMHKDQLAKLNESLASETPDYDLLYPYCQSTNIDDFVEFQIEIPASYILSGVKKLINLFDGIDGEDHRIVFWFDN